VVTERRSGVPLPAASSAPARVAACSVKPSSDAQSGLSYPIARLRRRQAPLPRGARGRRLTRGGGRLEAPLRFVFAPVLPRGASARFT